MTASPREVPSAPLSPRLAVLRQLAEQVNRHVTLTPMLDTALALLLDAFDLDTGWITLRQEEGGFTLAAARGLPPALEADDRAALRWSPCTCQTMLLQGELNQGTHIIHCERIERVRERLAAEGQCAKEALRDLKTHVSIPLTSEGRAIGILNLARSATESLDDRDLSLLTLAGDILGTAIHRAQLVAQLQGDRMREQETLIRLAEALLPLDETRRVAEVLSQTVQEALHVDGTLLIISHGALSLEMLSRGLPAESLRVSAKALRHMNEQRRRYGLLTVVSPSPIQPTTPPVESSLMVTLNAPHRVLGCLCLYNQQRRTFTPFERHLLTLMAHQGAVALQRVLAYERLTTSEARFRTLYENVPIGLFRVRPNGRLLEANRRLVDLFGFPDRDTLLRQNLRELHTPPLSPEEWSCALPSGEDIVEEEVRLRRRDGHLWWGLMRLSAHTDEQGRVLYLEGAIKDITPRKKAETRLQREQERLTLYNRILTLTLQRRDPDALLKAVLEELAAYLKVDVGGFYLREEEALVLHADLGLPESLRTQVKRLPLHELPDMFRQAGVIQERLQEHHLIDVVGKQLQVQSVAIIPLSLPGSASNAEAPLGILILGNRRYGVLDREEIRALREMAPQVALGIHYLQLYRQAETRLTRLSILHEIDRAIMQRLDLQAVVDVILSHIPVTLGGDLVALSLWDEVEDGAGVFRMHFPSAAMAEETARRLDAHLRPEFTGQEEAIVSENASQDARLQPFSDALRRAGLVSYLGMPLRAAGRTIGVLHIFTAAPRHFTEEDVAFFHTLAGQAAIAIQNARAYTQAKEQARAVQTMLEAQITLAAQIRSPEAVLAVILQAMKNALRAFRVAFFRYDSSRGDLVLEREVDGRPRPETVEPVRWALGMARGLVGLAALSRESLYLPQTQDDPRWIVRDPRVRSAYLIPLEFTGRLFGVLSLESERPHAFPASRRALADLFAHYSAATLEGQRTLTEAQQRARWLSTLNTIATAAAAATDVQTLLDHALEQVLTTLDANAGSFWVMGFSATRGISPTLSAEANRIARKAGFDIAASIPTEDWEAVPDTHPLAALKPIMRKCGLRSSLTVPVLGRETRVGGLSVARKEPHAWTREEIALVETVGRELGTAAERIQLFQEAQERAQRLTMLAKVSERINQQHTLSAISEAIGQGGRELLHADAGAFFLRTGETSVTCPWFEGLSRDYIKRVLALIPQHPLARTLSQKAPFITEDAAHLPQPLREHILALHEHFQAFAAWPLVYEGETVAALVLYWYEPYTLSPVDKNVLGLFVRQAAVALENARLHDTLVTTNEALRDALQAREDMLRNMTHELRTPLTMVRGYAELMTMGIITDPEEVGSSAQIILDQAKHLEHLINQLLLLQRLRHQDLEMMAIDVKEWLGRVAAAWHLPMQDAHITLQVEVAPDTGAIRGHPDYLDQVLNNLLDNARKFSPEGGTIRMQAHTQGNEVVISVSDEGIGIPPDKLEKVFERFYQVDASPTRRFGGTGTGLALAREIVERHGGHIWADSEGEGHGTTIIFTLPRATPP